MDDNITICTVCVANYNGGEIISKCIDSILNQTVFNEGIEIIVHDDCSSDDSVNIIKNKYPKVKLICSDMNVGFCESNNRMAAIARGDYILLLNNDAALWPDSLEVLINYADLHELVGITTLPQFDLKTKNIVDRGCLLDPFYNSVPNLNPDRGDVAMVIGACMWMPSSLWKELGGFPVWMESIAEDAFLCCKARMKGYAVQVVDGSGYWHMQGGSFGGNRASVQKISSTFKRRILSERNKTYLLCVFSPGWLVVFLLPMHVFFLIIEGFVISLLKFDFSIFTKIYYNCFVEVFRGRSVIFKERKSLKKYKKISSISFFKNFSFWPRKIYLLLKYKIPTIK